MKLYLVWFKNVGNNEEALLDIFTTKEKAYAEAVERQKKKTYWRDLVYVNEWEVQE